MKKGLICVDWDGTLLESSNTITQCIKKTLVQLGLPIPSNQVLCKLTGESEERIMRICLKNDMQHSALFWPIFRSIYSSSELTLEKGAIEFLERHKSFNIAIVSNKNLQCLLSEIQHFNILPMIDRIYAANCYEPKPEPTMILEAMHDTSTLAEHTWMLGDSIADAEAATLAHVSYIPVNAMSWREDFFVLDEINIRQPIV